MVETDTIAVSGCRVVPGGLHLGHLYGCFDGVETLGISHHFFVLADCQREVQQKLQNGLADMLQDCLAIAAIRPKVDLVVVRESVLRRSLADLSTILMHVSTFNEGISIHPQKSRLRNDSRGILLSDFLFPCFQASVMVGMAAKWAVFNDDNAPFVYYSRRLARRANQRLGLNLHTGVELFRRQPPHLLGPDGKRMSRSNKNYLSLGAPQAHVMRFGGRLETAVCKSPEADIVAGYERLFPGQIEPNRFEPTGSGIWNFLREFRASRKAVGTLTADAMESLLDRGEVFAKRRIQKCLREAGL